MCACTGDVADATIASAIGTRGIVGSTNAFAWCTSVSSAVATAIASGTGDIARSTGAMRIATAAPTVPTSASDNDLTEVCGGTIGMRRGTADIACRTSVPSWSTILLDRRSSLIGGPTRTIPAGTVSRSGARSTSSGAPAMSMVHGRGREVDGRAELPSQLAERGDEGSDDVSTNF
jgi:hypothetical protein